MDFLLTEFSNLFTFQGFLILLNIILIDIVMSGDNAILIGMATRKLQGKDRKKAIFIGIMLATILRIIFAFFAVYLLSIVGLKFAGGLLLLYVVWKFYREIRMENHEEHNIDAKNTGLLVAIYTIVIADVSMSLDNVLAVAGAAHENLVALGIGLIVSIMLMALASNFIAKYLNTYSQIQWVGLFVILFVAIEMILSGSHELDTKILHINILPFILFILGGLFIILHQKYIRPIDEKHLRLWLHDHTLKIIGFGVILVAILLFFGEMIGGYVRTHESMFYAAIFILFFISLELIALVKMRGKIISKTSKRLTK